MKNNKIATGLALFILLCIVMALVSPNTDSSSFSVGDVGTTQVQNTKQIISTSLNEDIQLGGLSYTVEGSSEEKIIQSTYGSPVSAKEGAKFVIVDLTVMNEGTTDFTLFPDDFFFLEDSQGRRFQTYDDTIGAINNYLNVRSISPGIKEDGKLVYEVPESATSYKFIGVPKSGDAYSVTLK